MIAAIRCRRRAVYDRWFGRNCVLLAWAGLCVALVHPPQGTGLKVCWVSASTGVPCPGCGMTRAISCAAHGDLALSWSYHPFGVPLLVLFVATAVLSVLPSALRRRFATGVMRHHGPVNIAYVAFVSSFVAFGALRVLATVIGI